MSDLLKAAFVKRLWKQFPPRHGFIAPPVSVLNDHRSSQNHHQRLEAAGQKNGLADSLKRLDIHVQLAALKSHHAGQILIAIDPGAPTARIAKGIASAVKDWRNGRKPMDSGKSHVGQWLDVIAKFETALSSLQKKEKRSDQLFARYRRVIQDWPLPPDGISPR